MNARTVPELGSLWVWDDGVTIIVIGIAATRAEARVFRVFCGRSCETFYPLEWFYDDGRGRYCHDEKEFKMISPGEKRHE